MDLTQGKRYVITVTTNFVGEFTGYEDDEVTGLRMACFRQDGRADRGKVPMRKVRPDNIVSAELTKVVAR